MYDSSLTQRSCFVALWLLWRVFLSEPSRRTYLENEIDAPAPATSGLSSEENLFDKVLFSKFSKPDCKLLV